MFPSPYGFPVMMAPAAAAAPRRSSRRRGMSSKTKKYIKKLKRKVKTVGRLRKLVASWPQGGPTRLNLLGADYKSADDTQKLFRKAIGFKGKGDYGWQGAAFRGAGETLGSLFGHGQTGRGLGARLSKYLGFGDYAGEAGGNQIMAGSVDTPITVNSGTDLSGDVYISHREFLGNVTALATGVSTPSAFNLVQYQLNAGLQQTFPWLSQIAQNFTMYELQGCIFEYKATSGELGSASNALGKVIMATQYDPDAGVFGSSVEMENYDYSNACKPSEHMVHGIETAVSQRATNLLYVRTGPSPKSKIFTDMGLFQIATEGIPLGAPNGTIVNIGELWVTYRVKLSRAQLHGSLLGANIATDILEGWANGTNSVTANTVTQLAASTYAGSFNAQRAINYFVEKKTNGIGCSAISTAFDTMRVSFPSNIVSGVFQIDCYMLLPSAGTAIQWVSPASLTFCSIVNYPASSTGANTLKGGTATNTTSSIATQTFWVKVIAPGTNVAYFDVSVVGATVANTQYVIQITESNALAITVT